jgi:hypothetical protein
MLYRSLYFESVPQKHLTNNIYWGTVNEVAIMQELQELRANAEAENQPEAE